MPKPRLHRRAAIWAACAAMAGVGVVWAGHSAWAALGNRSTPSCSWPVRIQGNATPAQAGLVRCYVSALAHRDTAALLAVAPTIPPVRITRADLAYSADARSGRTTVTFLAALVDSDWIPVIITYADGATDRLGVQNMIEMGGPSIWRMAIGTDVNQNQGPPGAPPAAMLGVKVPGVFVMVGGPPPGVRLPLPGHIVATNTAGRRFTGTVGTSGRFKMWLPPGTYRLTGRSPREQAGHHGMRCGAANLVHVRAGILTPRVEVVCPVP